MTWKKRRDVKLEDMPDGLWPDLDAWGTPAEERKRAKRDEWLEANDLTGAFYFEWAPAYLAERRRLAGMPPPPPARRKGPLPAQVQRLLAELEPRQEVQEKEKHEKTT